MRTGRTNKMTRNWFPVQKKMLESWNKPNESLIIQKNWTKYNETANSKIKMTLIAVRAILHYIFHMWRKLYATLIGRITFFTCEI